MHRLLSLSLLGLLSACATVPMASPQQDQEAKQFPRPASEKGALYVYREGWMALAKTVDVVIVGGAQAQLASNTYLRLEGPAGPLEVACKADEATASHHIEIAPGEVRFLEVAMKPGLWGARCVVNEVRPDRGQAAIRGAKRVDAM